MLNFNFGFFGVFWIWFFCCSGGWCLSGGSCSGWFWSGSGRFFSGGSWFFGGCLSFGGSSWFFCSGGWCFCGGSGCSWSFGGGGGGRWGCCVWFEWYRFVMISIVIRWLGGLVFDG